MANITVYSTAMCPYCVQAKKLLEQKGLSYTEVRIDQDPAKREEMVEKSQRRTVPQIFINDEHVGGFDDLKAWNQQGKLDNLT